MDHQVDGVGCRLWAMSATDLSGRLNSGFVRHLQATGLVDDR